MHRWTRLFFFLAFFSLAITQMVFAQFYDVSLIRANDSMVQPSLRYDLNSTSYKDNTFENPDLLLRICTADANDLEGKYIALTYADGIDGKYLLLTHTPVQIHNVSPSGCKVMPMDISSFKAWYPSIPYVFIADDKNFTINHSRWKLSRSRGWFNGNFTVTEDRIPSLDNVTVINSTDDHNLTIIPDVDYLVVGLVRPDFTTIDTVITSPYNMSSLYWDGGPYVICVNGICPEQPPYVKIITPANGSVWTTTQIPFTYTMISDVGIVSCNYTLDSITVVMPSCSVAYILNAAVGIHTLTLRGTDLNGASASDTVTFEVTSALPPRPPSPGGGPPVEYPILPVVPPSPAGIYFWIDPQDIYVVMDYPKDGLANFDVHATAPLQDVQCFLRSDFEPYSTILLDSHTLTPNTSIHGIINVSMIPNTMLTYPGGFTGILQCTGYSDPSLISSTVSNVYLIINKPALAMQNLTLNLTPGDSLNESTVIWIVGAPNVTTFNMTPVVRDYPFLVEITGYPPELMPGETGELRFKVTIPPDFDGGVYVIPVEFYESGVKIGQGTITLNVTLARCPQLVCSYPDLRWTVIILLMGIIASIVIFIYVEREKRRREHRGIPPAPPYMRPSPWKRESSASPSQSQTPPSTPVREHGSHEHTMREHPTHEYVMHGYKINRQWSMSRDTHDTRPSHLSPHSPSHGNNHGHAQQNQTIVRKTEVEK